MRTPIAFLTVLAVAVAVAVAVAPAASAAAIRTCPQSDAANGLSRLRAEGIACKRAFAVAKRTNSVKCFLEGTRCTHEFRGRRWTCRLDEGDSRVTCRSGRRLVGYRLG